MRAALLAAFLITAVAPVEAAELTGQASVVDGDTIEIHGQRVRLYGIDAPEGPQLCYREVEPWPCGRRAAFALADRIGDRTVTCEPRDRDRYGRMVAVCFAGGEDVNAWMARQGLGAGLSALHSDLRRGRRSRPRGWGGHLGRTIHAALELAPRRTPGAVRVASARVSGT